MTVNLKHFFCGHIDIFSSGLFSAVLSIPLSGQASGNDFNLLEVDEGVYVHTGRHVSIEDEKRDDIANIGFIIGDDCIAVVDTGGSTKIGKRLLHAIRSKSDKKICFVINTHIHFDHLLGNAAFSDEKPVFVGHHHLKEEVEQNRDFFLQQFEKELGMNPGIDSIIGPEKLVADSEHLDLGNRKLTLTAFPVSHSHSDLIVLDEKTGTLWAGDLIFRERIPSLTGSLNGWLKSIDKLKTLTVNHVIPGHGSIADSVTDAIQQQENYLLQLLEQTRRAIAEGQFINEAMETVDKNNTLNWLLHEYQHPANVSRAYTELEWE